MRAFLAWLLIGAVLTIGSGLGAADSGVIDRSPEGSKILFGEAAFWEVASMIGGFYLLATLVVWAVVALLDD